MKSRYKVAVTLLSLVVLLTLLPNVLAQGATITITQDGLMPSAIVYDAAAGHFLVSAAGEGTIYAVGMDGAATPLIQDEALGTVSDMAIDPAAHTLTVVSGIGGRMDFGPGMGGQTGPGARDGEEAPPQGERPQEMPGEIDPSQIPPTTLLTYDLDSGTLLHTVDLSAVVEGTHTGGSLTLDDAGNAYVADSLGGVIYMVDPAGTAYYMANEALSAEGASLQGIAYHPDGYLIVAQNVFADQSSTTELWKIPLSDPANVTPVSLTTALPRIINMTINDAGDLIITGSNNQPMTQEQGPGAAVIVTLHSDDTWASATVASQTEVATNVTDSALASDALYLLSSGMRARPGTEETNASTPATITQVSLDS